MVSLVVTATEQCLRVSHLSRRLLANKTCSLLVGGASQSQAQAFDVGVRRGAILATLVLDLANLDHVDCESSRAFVEVVDGEPVEVRGGRREHGE